MKLISLVVGIGALVWIALAIERWWFRFPDTSQLILALIAGVGALYVAYDYNWKRNKNDEDRKQTKRLDALVMWWTKQEKDQVKSTARGNGDE